MDLLGTTLMTILNYEREPYVHVHDSGSLSEENTDSGSCAGWPSVDTMLTSATTVCCNRGSLLGTAPTLQRPMLGEPYFGLYKTIWFILSKCYSRGSTARLGSVPHCVAFLLKE